MEGTRILVVDDERAIAELVEIHLLSDGCQVWRAESGPDALQILAENEIDLAILDIMMPGMDGLELCRQIRRDRNIPILMLSAKSEDVDKILGLKTGADDYLTKPFNPLELVARVKAQLRRYLYLNPGAAAAAPDERVTVRGLEIDKARHTVTAFPREHWRQIHSTNPLERLNKEIKRRIDVVGVFPNRNSVLRLVGALLAEQSDEWAAGRRYFSLESMAKMAPQGDTQQPPMLSAGD